MREHLALQEGELAHDVAGLEFFFRWAPEHIKGNPRHEVFLLTCHFLKRVQNEFSVVLFGLTQEPAELV
jgi:hypothetical protein